VTTDVIEFILAWWAGVKSCDDTVESKRNLERFRRYADPEDGIGGMMSVSFVDMYVVVPELIW
jgi:hypothetical protein